MPILTWTEDMTTGVRELDAQHRELIRMLNNLHDSMRAGQASAIVQQLIDGLLAYAAKHFAREEACMTRYGCPLASTNATAHKLFVQRLQSFQTRLQRTGASAALVLELQRELADWLKLHICRTDARLANYVS